MWESSNNNCRLLLVRHGQTDWNAERKIQGLIDRPLNDLGRKQAQELAAQLSEFKVGAIYSSPLARTRETAEWIRKRHDCPFYLDPDLREGTCGPIEGLTWDEYYSFYAEELEKRKGYSIEEKLAHRIVPNCESGLEIYFRVANSLKKICRAHPAQSVVIVTHGFVIRALLSKMNNYDDGEIDVSNTGLLKIEGDGEELFLVGHEGIHIGGAT